MADGDHAATAAEAVAHRLRQDIVAGDLAPAAKLRLRDLVERYGIGTTPLREALSRLVAEGFVNGEGQKGFSVPPVTRAHLLDITRTRQMLEPEALRLAMQAGDAAWEDGIVASLSLLKREIERRDPANPAWQDSYEAKHHRFHRALIAACPLRSLTGFCDELYVQMTRYRRVMKTVLVDWNRATPVHENLATLALARDEATAMAALREHIGTTADHVLPVLFGPDGQDPRDLP